MNEIMYHIVQKLGGQAMFGSELALFIPFLIIMKERFKIHRDRFSTEYSNDKQVRYILSVTIENNFRYVCNVDRLILIITVIPSIILSYVASDITESGKKFTELTINQQNIISYSVFFFFVSILIIWWEYDSLLYYKLKIKYGFK